jgi:hypothetical protein
MTKKDFFITVIRLFGLYVLTGVLFNTVPMNITYLFEISSLFIVLISLFSIFIPIGLFVLLIFKAEKIVNILKLDQGFDEDRINFGNLNGTEILKIAIFILGGLILIESIPIFIKNLISSLEMSINGGELDHYIKFYWAVAFIKIVLGYLLVTYYEKIAIHFQKR